MDKIHLPIALREQHMTITTLRHMANAQKLVIDDLHNLNEDLRKRNQVLSQLAHEASVKMCSQANHIAELQATINGLVKQIGDKK